MLEQRHPRTGEQLARPVADRLRTGPDGREQMLSARAGWDAQFASPKSVSVLWAVGDARTSRAVEAAIDKGVTAAFRSLQDRAVSTRVGKGGARRIRSEGLVAATFRHDTSRSGDPQYHVHGVIANITYAEGRWLRLDEHALNVHRLAADRVFQAHMRAELTERLGVAWVPGRTAGTYEIAGISQAVIDEHSRRRAQILERVDVGASPASKEARTRHPRAEGSWPDARRASRRAAGPSSRTRARPRRHRGAPRQGRARHRAARRRSRGSSRRAGRIDIGQIRVRSPSRDQCHGRGLPGGPALSGSRAGRGEGPRA